MVNVANLVVVLIVSHRAGSLSVFRVSKGLEVHSSVSIARAYDRFFQRERSPRE
ncbi:MAG: hypothetical protein ACI9BW_000947 [Gammaproteobacteria bacterium]|jgi:hypothetical protein